MPAPARRRDARRFDPAGRGRALRFLRGGARHALGPAAAGPEGDARLRRRVLDRVRERLAREPESETCSISCAWRPFTRTCMRRPFIYAADVGVRGFRGRDFSIFRSNEDLGDIESPAATFMLGAEPRNGFRVRQREMGARSRARAVPHRARAGQQRAVPGVRRRGRRGAALLEEGGRPTGCSGASIAGCRSRRRSRCAT